MVTKRMSAEEALKLLEAFRTYREQIARLVRDAEQQDGDDLQWDCPMCGGEGYVDYCLEHGAESLAEEMGCIGVQVFGIGNGLHDVQFLLESLLKHGEDLLSRVAYPMGFGAPNSPIIETP